MNLQIEGPAVDTIQWVFIKDYHFASKEKILISEKYLSENPARGNTRVQIVTSGPDSKQPAVMQQYIAINNSARESIFIANPYFILGTTVIESLKIATLDGITISLLIPKKSDSLMARYSIFF